MSKPMIERVARVICSGAIDPDGECAGTPFWHLYVQDARAAIAAMREPDEAMLSAASPFADDDGPITVWKTMIDAALSEEGE